VNVINERKKMTMRGVLCLDQKQRNEKKIHKPKRTDLLNERRRGKSFEGKKRSNNKSTLQGQNVRPVVCFMLVSRADAAAIKRSKQIVKTNQIIVPQVFFAPWPPYTQAKDNAIRGWSSHTAACQFLCEFRRCRRLAKTSRSSSAPGSAYP